MRVHHATWERPRNSGSDDFMNPASTTRSGSKAATVSVSELSQRAATDEVVDPAYERRDAGLVGPCQPLVSSRSAPTATTAAPYAGSYGVEQGLEVGARAGDEYDKTGCGHRHRLPRALTVWRGPH